MEKFVLFNRDDSHCRRRKNAAKSRSFSREARKEASKQAACSFFPSPLISPSARAWRKYCLTEIGYLCDDASASFPFTLDKFPNQTGQLISDVYVLQKLGLQLFLGTWLQVPWVHQMRERNCTPIIHDKKWNANIDPSEGGPPTKGRL